MEHIPLEMEGCSSKTLHPVAFVLATLMCIGSHSRPWHPVPSSGGAGRPTLGSTMKDSVKILLLGDERVGKSSLISSFVSQCFSEKVPAVHTPVQIPPSESLEKVTTIIVDSSSIINEQLRARVREADAIILVYDHGRRETLNNLGAVWLPLIQEVWGPDAHKPVVLAGNKHDLKPPAEGGREDLDGGAASASSSISLITPLLEKYRFVLNNFDECSAKTLDEVPEVFVSAQKLVLYPVWPLYDIRARDFTPRLRRVLGRIFRLFDHDRDNLLSDGELMALQERCFRSTLQQEDVEEVRGIVAKNVPEGVQPGGITLRGLEGILRLFIEQMQVDMPWTMLRTLGYNDDLELEPPREGEEGLIATRADTAAELTPEAVQALARLFEQFATRGVGLTEDGLQEIFSVLPEGEGWPWDSAGEDGPIHCLALPLLLPRQTDESGAAEARGIQPLDVNQWLGLWQMVVAVNPEAALRQLRLLGICCDESVVPPADRLLHIGRRWRRPSSQSSSSSSSRSRSIGGSSKSHKRNASSSSFASHYSSRAARRVLCALVVNTTSPEGSPDADALLYTLCGLAPPSRPSPALSASSSSPTGLRACVLPNRRTPQPDPSCLVIIEASCPSSSDPTEAAQQLTQRVQAGAELCDAVLLIVDGRSSDSIASTLRLLSDDTLCPLKDKPLPLLFLLKGAPPAQQPASPPRSPRSPSSASPLTLLPEPLRAAASRHLIRRVVSLPTDPLLARRELEDVPTHVASLFAQGQSASGAAGNVARAMGMDLGPFTVLVTIGLVSAAAVTCWLRYAKRHQR